MNGKPHCSSRGAVRARPRFVFASTHDGRVSIGGFGLGRTIINTKRCRRAARSRPSRSRGSNVLTYLGRPLGRRRRRVPQRNGPSWAGVRRHDCWLALALLLAKKAHWLALSCWLDSVGNCS